MGIQLLEMTLAKITGVKSQKNYVKAHAVAIQIEHNFFFRPIGPQTLFLTVNIENEYWCFKYVQKTFILIQIMLESFITHCKFSLSSGLRSAFSYLLRLTHVYSFRMAFLGGVDIPSMALGCGKVVAGGCRFTTKLFKAKKNKAGRRHKAQKPPSRSRSFVQSKAVFLPSISETEVVQAMPSAWSSWGCCVKVPSDLGEIEKQE